MFIYSRGKTFGEGIFTDHFNRQSQMQPYYQEKLINELGEGMPPFKNLAECKYVIDESLPGQKAG